LKQAPGASVDVSVFRKLEPLDYLTSYSPDGGWSLTGLTAAYHAWKVCEMPDCPATFT
jgi:hypothetical protein